MDTSRIDKVAMLFANRRLSRRQALTQSGAGLAAAGLAAAGVAAVTVSRPGADPPYRHELE